MISPNPMAVLDRRAPAALAGPPAAAPIEAGDAQCLAFLHRLDCERQALEDLARATVFALCRGPDAFHETVLRSTLESLGRLAATRDALRVRER